MEVEPVDHKDKPGDYRRGVRDGVFGRVGDVGHPIDRPDQLRGQWSVSFVGIPGGRSATTFTYWLAGDGGAVTQLAGRAPSAGHGWQLNPDGTVSLFHLCPAMPEYGLTEPTHEEQRFHAAALPGGRLVLWNGDGSLVKLLEPVQPPTVPTF